MTPTLTGTTQLIALLADPIDHVRAQMALNRRFVERGVDAAVVPLNVDAHHFTDAFEILRRSANVSGLLLTVPHKSAAAALCETLGPNARAVGAVNAIRFDASGDPIAHDGRRRAHGEIFDGVGLIAAAHANDFSFTDRRVLVVGTGGAGTAVAAAIAAEQPHELTLHNRTSATAQDLARILENVCPTAVGPATAVGHDIVVNCTSLGLHDGDPIPIDLTGIDSHTSVIDIIANPEWTPLRRLATNLGCPTMGGGPMIDHQLDAIAAHILNTPATGRNAPDKAT